MTTNTVPTKAGKTTTEEKDPVAAKLGERIKQVRMERGKTIEEIAAAAMISSRYLWRVEDGRQNLSLRNVARIATALPIALSELFEGVPN